MFMYTFSRTYSMYFFVRTYWNGSVVEQKWNSSRTILNSELLKVYDLKQYKLNRKQNFRC